MVDTTRYIIYFGTIYIFVASAQFTSCRNISQGIPLEHGRGTSTRSFKLVAGRIASILSRGYGSKNWGSFGNELMQTNKQKNQNKLRHTQHYQIHILPSTFSANTFIFISTGCQCNIIYRVMHVQIIVISFFIITLNSILIVLFYEKYVTLDFV